MRKVPTTSHLVHDCAMQRPIRSRLSRERQMLARHEPDGAGNKSGHSTAGAGSEVVNTAGGTAQRFYSELLKRIRDGRDQRKDR